MSVGEAFLTFVPAMRMYDQFTANHEVALLTLQKFTTYVIHSCDRSARFQELIGRCV